MIGDQLETDILGAHHIGIDQLYLNRENKKTSAPLPTYEVHSLAEIKAIL